MERTEKLESFLNKIKDIYGDELGTNIIDSIQKETPVSFRVNTLKITVDEALKKLKDLGFKVGTGDFPNSFYIQDSVNNLSLSKTDLFDNGQIYIQNFSSMVPTFILDPKPGEKILDLCAAPGSKTTHIATLANNKANIFAVENNVNRFNVLKKNCELQGLENIEFLRLSSQELCSKRPQYLGYFDKVLCDVPCSNEGLLRNLDSQSFTYWNSKNAKKLSVLQKKLISTGIQMLKNGGTLVYSTCTYSVEENEQVIDWALRKFPEIKLVRLSLAGVTTLPGITEWKNKTYASSISNTLRILPGDLYEGFFIAQLEKKK